MSREEEENEILAVDERPAEFNAAGREFGHTAYGISIAARDRNAVNNRHGSAIRITKTELPPASAPCRLADEKLRQSERRLRQSHKLEAMAALTGGVVHDFNNLLTAIIGNAQLALSRLAPEDPLRHRLTEIEKATDRAALLTRQLLAFNRRSPAEPRQINLNDSVTEIFKLLRRIVGEDVEISIECAPDAGQIFADPEQIEQILMNLCAVARQALPSGGTLRIETSGFEPEENYRRAFPSVRAGRYARVSFAVGGAPDEQIRARFSESIDCADVSGRDADFGLSTVCDIVKQNGGHINVGGEPGRETRVEILLPIASADAPTERRTIDRARFGGAETVLVAEDEETLRNLAQDVLTRLGYTVLLAKNGEEAVEIYTANRDRVDLLLFDVVMPRMSGVEAYERIKNLRAGAPVPLIFMTGYSAETIQNRFVGKSADADVAGARAIQKPYNVARLGGAVRDVLDARLGDGAELI